MADIHRLPGIKKVEREASEWIARLDADDVSADDRTRFEVWLHADALHARTYEELMGTWRQCAQAPLRTRAAAVAWSRQRHSTRHRSRRWRQVAMAMSGVAAAVLFGVYLHFLTMDATFETALGERATVSLPDGSTLQLNSDSRAHVDYTLRSRVIHLERGEAFFNVAHDVNRTFWVTTGKSWVRAVGTAFGVYLSQQGVRVTVHEGVVKLGSAEHVLPASPSERTLQTASAVLTAGEQADLEGRVATTRKLSAEELARVDAWRDGWLYVENENLCDVIAELNRYTPRQLILDDTHLCSLSVGGSFQTNPQGAEAMLSMLEGNFGAQIHRDGDRVYIQGEPNPSVQP